MAGSIEGTLNHALFLARHLNTGDLHCKALVVLLELGFPTDRDGFQYLKNAIVFYCAKPRQMITKEIYPAVGRLYDPQAGERQVETAIRSVIKEAWENRDEEVWACYFPKDRNGTVKRPTNREFVSRVACFLELWQNCCKEVAYE